MVLVTPWRRHLRLPDMLPFRSLSLLALAAVLAGCWDDADRTAGPDPDIELARQGRLQATPAQPTRSIAPGLSVQRLSETGRPFGVYVPASYSSTVPAPVVVMLHGRGQSGEALAFDFQRFADTAGVIVVAPNSRSVTWDLILQDVGFDVAFIDGVLRWTFDHINVDPARLTLAGFSDGATYATWLGLRNGSLFGKLAVFSGCATLPTGRVGTPAIYVTHGVNDTAFPIEDCAQLLVPGLLERGYSTEYLAYDGGHIIPIAVADTVFAWIAGR
jgi:phospholipase/carboxylesterase